MRKTKALFQIMVMVVAIVAFSYNVSAAKTSVKVVENGAEIPKQPAGTYECKNKPCTISPNLKFLGIVKVQGGSYLLDGALDTTPAKTAMVNVLVNSLSGTSIQGKCGKGVCNVNGVQVPAGCSFSYDTNSKVLKPSATCKGNFNVPDMVNNKIRIEPQQGSRISLRDGTTITGATYLLCDSNGCSVEGKGAVVKKGDKILVLREGKLSLPNGGPIVGIPGKSGSFIGQYGVAGQGMINIVSENNRKVQLGGSCLPMTEGMNCVSVSDRKEGSLNEQCKKNPNQAICKNNRVLTLTGENLKVTTFSNDGVPTLAAHVEVLPTGNSGKPILLTEQDSVYGPITHTFFPGLHASIKSCADPTKSCTFKTSYLDSLTYFDGTKKLNKYAKPCPAQEIKGGAACDYPGVSFFYDRSNAVDENGRPCTEKSKACYGKWQSAPVRKDVNGRCSQQPGGSSATSFFSFIGRSVGIISDGGDESSGGLLEITGRVIDPITIGFLICAGVIVAGVVGYVAWRDYAGGFEYKGQTKIRGQFTWLSKPVQGLTIVDKYMESSLKYMSPSIPEGTVLKVLDVTSAGDHTGVPGCDDCFILITQNGEFVGYLSQSQERFYAGESSGGDFTATVVKKITVGETASAVAGGKNYLIPCQVCMKACYVGGDPTQSSDLADCIEKKCKSVCGQGEGASADVVTEDN
ncbi:hypothetical protein COV19_07715 [Candidatus Woesearchaeota archaeon CG10_big_fil_rev_8_21_14_0_10_44_13]|nr:MAG: hypothetical protein COV19_07715 [Candidatus Woesearchaeota archaeon CG10_big_fil_rev_8_21_14_0_10_44_13]